jgi:hypothetical protein
MNYTTTMIQRFAITHTVGHTDTPVSPDSLVTTTPSVKMFCPQKKSLLLILRKNTTCWSFDLWRICKVYSDGSHIVYRWVMTNCCVTLGTERTVYIAPAAASSHYSHTHTHTHDSSSPHRKHAVFTALYSACTIVVVSTLTTFVSLGSYLSENTALVTLNHCLGLNTYCTQNGNHGNTTVPSSLQGWYLSGGWIFIIIVTSRLTIPYSHCQNVRFPYSLWLS